MEWSIAGLPLHPLVVHAAVVFTPLAALAALAYVFLGALPRPAAVADPGARGRRRALGLGGVPHGRRTSSTATASPTSRARRWTRSRRTRATPTTLRWIASAFGIVTVAATYFYHDRTGTVRTVLGALVAISAVATLVWVALTGDAGARAVWG